MRRTELEGNPKLVRSLGFWALVAYGVGDILGAGIYALVGKIAGIAGSASWIAFAVAMSVAALTALSYAELGSRFPKSGGESQFSFEAFQSPGLALFVGWLVLCSGVVSMATVSRAFAEYALGSVAAAPGWSEDVLVVAFLVMLAAINFWGIRLSSRTNIVCTMVELFGLLLVIVVGLHFLLGDQPTALEPKPAQGADVVSWFAITQGAALAFFAFIGFEDMVNVSEEVKSPRRTLPRAIIAALVIASSIYILVVAVATAVVPPHELATIKGPLREVVHRAAPSIPLWSFTLIALFAVANTGLLNFIMGSRLLYGMAQQRLVPRWLSSVHPRTRTPHWAIVVLLVAVSALALSGSLVYLAGTTSLLLLLVFFVVNLSVVVIRLRGSSPEENVFAVPIVIPVMGVVFTLALTAFVPSRSLLVATILIVVGMLFVALAKVKNRMTTNRDRLA